MAYLGAHWALERRCFAGGAIPCVDMMYLIQRRGQEIDWKQLLVSLAGCTVASHLFLMLGFLNKHKLIALPPRFLERLAEILRFPLAGNETILHGLMEKYCMRGIPFGKITTETNIGILWETLLTPGPAWKNLIRTPQNILFPPQDKRRFNLAFQAGRISRALGFKYGRNLARSG